MTAYTGFNPPVIDIFQAPQYDPFTALPDVPAVSPGLVFGHPTDATDQRVSSGYGARSRPVAGASKFHPAYDIVTPMPGEINRNNATAAAPGEVVFAGRKGGYGNTVIVDHGNGYQTHYAHLDSISGLKPGDKVFQGDELGSVGNTGLKNMGYHLDFAVYKDGVKVNPETVGYGMRPTSLSNRPSLEVPAAFEPGPIANVQDYAMAKGSAAPIAPEPPPVPMARPEIGPGIGPEIGPLFAMTDTPAAPAAMQAADALATGALNAPTAPVPEPKPEPMTVTPEDVLAAYNRQNGPVGTPAPGAPIPEARPPSGAPMPTPNPLAMADRIGPTPTPNPLAMEDRAPPVPTANPLNAPDPLVTIMAGSQTAGAPPTAQPLTQQQFNARWNGGATPTAAAPVPTAAPSAPMPSPTQPSGPTNAQGFVQGLAPSLVDKAKELGLQAPEGQVIGYSPLAPNGLTAVNPNAGPAATGPGIFGFMERDFGFGGGAPQGLASYAAGTPGRLGGSILGGAAGTALGGPVGGLLGALAGGWAGGRLSSGLASQNAASALGQQPQQSGLLSGLLGGIFGGGDIATASVTPTTSTSADLGSYNDLTDRGGLW